MRVAIGVIFRGEPLTTPLDAAQSSVDDIFVAYTSVCMLAESQTSEKLKSSIDLVVIPRSGYENQPRVAALWRLPWVNGSMIATPPGLWQFRSSTIEIPS
jgi:hypothetical protein